METLNYCIYLKDTEPNLSFQSQEHIFPAGIGGKQVLPKGYVSHQCNQAFSKMELEFMRHSIIALARQFQGPGKRGSLSPAKASKSLISLMKSQSVPDSVEFGYLSVGKPYTIPQIKMSLKGTCNLYLNKSFEDYEQTIHDFLDKLANFEGKYILHESEMFAEDEFLLGYHGDKWHLGLSNKEIISKIDELIQKIIDQKPFEQLSLPPDERKHQVKIHQSISFDYDVFYRTCAKIVFNYLAYAKGQEFVLKSCFDPIRNWIVNGGEEGFARLTGRGEDEKLVFEELPFPEFSHKIIIISKGKDLIGLLSFYGTQFETIVHLSSDLDEPFQIEGFICDWKNQKELTFMDFLRSMR